MLVSLRNMKSGRPGIGDHAVASLLVVEWGPEVPEVPGVNESDERAIILMNEGPRNWVAMATTPHDHYVVVDGIPWQFRPKYPKTNSPLTQELPARA